MRRPAGADWNPFALTPRAFENFVADSFAALLRRGGTVVLAVEPRKRVRTADDQFEVDVFVRCRDGAGCDLIYLVEAKQWRTPVKQSVVRVLRDQLASAGAHKGVIVATSGFQRGARTWAARHGVALIDVVSGALAIQLRSKAGAAPVPPLARPALWHYDPATGLETWLRDEDWCAEYFHRVVLG